MAGPMKRGAPNPTKQPSKTPMQNIGTPMVGLPQMPMRGMPAKSGPARKTGGVAKGRRVAK